MPRNLNLQFNAPLGVDGVVAPQRVVVEGEEVVVPGVIAGQFTGVPHVLDGGGRGGTSAERRRRTADRKGQQAQQESLIGVGVACARRHFVMPVFRGLLCAAKKDTESKLGKILETNIDRTKGSEMPQQVERLERLLYTKRQEGLEVQVLGLVRASEEIGS